MAFYVSGGAMHYDRANPDPISVAAHLMRLERTKGRAPDSEALNKTYYEALAIGRKVLAGKTNISLERAINLVEQERLGNKYQPIKLFDAKPKMRSQAAAAFEQAILKIGSDDDVISAIHNESLTELNDIITKNLEIGLHLDKASYIKLVDLYLNDLSKDLRDKGYTEEQIIQVENSFRLDADFIFVD